MINIPTPYQPLAELLFDEKSEVRYVVCTGGRGSSKSYSIQTILCYFCLSIINGILFTRYTMKSAHKSIIPEFLEKIELLNANSLVDVTKEDIKFSHNKSLISFSGIKTSSGDQTANLKSLKGYNIWLLDEAEELVDEKKFDDIQLSFRQKGKRNVIILILNPTTKDHWIYKKFYEQRGVESGYNGIVGNTCYIHTTYLDNYNNLDESFIRDVKEIKKNNPSKYKHKILGGWIEKAEGVIYPNWKYGKFESNGLHGFGLDFGFSIDPTALVEVSIDKKLKKIYAKLHTYKEGLTTTQISNQLKVCKDALIVADSAEPRLISELNSKGHNIKKCQKGKGSITGGIAKVQDYELIIDNDSVNLGKELNNYTWHDKKSSTPIDDYNHALDALRYIVTDLLSNKREFFIV